MNWTTLNTSVTIEQGLKQLQQEGNLVYEYNPLKVFRTNKDISEKDPMTGKSLVVYPKGSLLDLNVSDSLLKFDLNHPLEMTTQQSYDGSVNLIINDGKNSPMLINTRFSSTGMDTYQIVDRQGDNDTNIYDEDTFSTDVSLYKSITTLPKLTFSGLGTGGNMRVGNYVFYFKLADSDGNETDFVAESGIVCCHIGNLNDPSSIQGGVEDNNSYKTVNFVLSNIDSAYNYINVYYTRSTSSYDGQEITTAAKISRSFEVANKSSKISITGFEEIQPMTVAEINKQYEVVDSAKCQAACQNMLFMGNVTDQEIAYKELADLAVRIYPSLVKGDSIGNVDQNYYDPTGGYEYYNAQNIYYKLGYWNDEIYRFGIVFILNNFTTSPVFNIRGTTKLSMSSSWQSFPIYNTDNSRNYVKIDKTTYDLGSNENAKGVSRIVFTENQFTSNGTIPLAVKMNFPPGVIDELKKHTKGFYFVRQKRIPTTLCQAVTIGLESRSLLPVLPTSDSMYGTESFIRANPEKKGVIDTTNLSTSKWDGTLTHNLSERWRSIGSNFVIQGYAAICPEFEQKQAYFNQIFTGSEFIIKPSINAFSKSYFEQNGRHFYNMGGTNGSSSIEAYNVITVPDGSPGVKNKKQLYKALAGEPETAFKVSYLAYQNRDDKADNIVRGMWGPYLGLEGRNTQTMSRIDIKIPNFNEGTMSEYFGIRYEDASPFYAIGDRTLWEDVKGTTSNTLYRGDCFICNYTHRMMRNFQDPSTPINDEIVDDQTWKDHYKIKDLPECEKINRADVNAVQLGHWVTFKVCSNINLSMRSADTMYPIEMGMTGRPRGFYPLQGMTATGESKIPESFISNSGMSSTTSDKYNFELPDVPALKTKFHTRIVYSDIAVNDAFKNGFRVFKSTHFNDYPLTYGAITQLVEWFGSLICVFEHGVALIPVNERAVAMEAAGGTAYINTHNVLPDNPKILSDTFGSQWSESVIKTPYYVYGVDTVGKKIWRTNGQTLETISDFKIQQFLNDNITLTEKEKTPTIGIRNVKTHYNQFKHDVMFTFYDDINTLEENVWNICFNEVMSKWTTFYSWVPSYSANIDNIFFSFDRDCSKTLARLTSNYPLVGMISPIISKKSTNLGSLQLNMDTGGLVPHFYIDDECVQGRFTITGNAVTTTATTVDHWEIPVRVELCNKDWTPNAEKVGVERILYSTVGVATKDFYDKQTTAFWKHGQAGLMKMKTDIKPTHWYGRQHPFEFEFIVAKDPQSQKIFNSLQLIANKAQPESFHFEVVGETYEFADDKKNMFFRQEALKHLYQYNGSDITYDPKYLTITPEQRDMPFSTSQYKDRSTMFPISYSRVDSLNSIEDHYQTIEKENHHYQYVSGSEIKYDELLNEFRIATHIGCCPFGQRYLQRISEAKFVALREQGYGYMTKVKDGNYYQVMTYGRITGNSEYKEDKWWVQIPPISYWQKNELEWSTGYPTLNLVNNPLPESMTRLSIKNDNNIPKALRDLGYSLSKQDCFETNRWSSRKETRIRDKYCKIKVRYSGTDLAVITAINTLYTISYA